MSLKRKAEHLTFCSAWVSQYDNSEKVKYLWVNIGEKETLKEKTKKCLIIFFFIYFNNNSNNNNSGNKNTSTKLPRESTAFPAVKTIPWWKYYKTISKNMNSVKATKVRSKHQQEKTVKQCKNKIKDIYGKSKDDITNLGHLLTSLNFIIISTKSLE